MNVKSKVQYERLTTIESFAILRLDYAVTTYVE